MTTPKPARWKSAVAAGLAAATAASLVLSAGLVLTAGAYAAAGCGVSYAGGPQTGRRLQAGGRDPAQAGR